MSVRSTSELYVTVISGKNSEFSKIHKTWITLFWPIFAIFGPRYPKTRVHFMGPKKKAMNPEPGSINVKKDDKIVSE